MPSFGTLRKGEAARPCGIVVASEAVVPAQLGYDRPKCRCCSAPCAHGDNRGGAHRGGAARLGSRVYTEEAAVELLIRSRWTRRAAFIDDVLAGHSDPGGRPWVDWEALGQILDGGRDNAILAASGGELRLAHSVAAGELGVAVPGLDSHAIALAWPRWPTPMAPTSTAVLPPGTRPGGSSTGAAGGVSPSRCCPRFTRGHPLPTN